MGVSVDIISIGTLSRNIFWKDAGSVRPAHATTSLIRSAGNTILVDPSLPPEMLAQRLEERTGLKPEQIDAVFLTNLRPIHRRGLALFAGVPWYVGEVERRAVLDGLRTAMDGANGASDGISDDQLRAELDLLGRTEPCPDNVAPAVHLFPSYGATPGSASLLVAGSGTIVVAGDALITCAHFERRQVWERSADPEMAKEAFAEICEVADAVVPGHDNIMYIG